MLLAGSAMAAACGHSSETAGEKARQPMDVKVATASVQSLARPFEAGGTVRARTTASLVSRIVADVDAVLVSPGDRVRAGQVLIRLDGRDLQANRARAAASAAAAEQAVRAAKTARDGAEASLALASATHKRISELQAKNSATEHELDQAVSGLRGAESQALGAQASVAQAEAGAVAAQAGLQAAAVAASWANITAPFDGVITEKMVEPGNMAAPGVSLMTIEDTGGFRLEVLVDESRAGEVNAARAVEVVLDTAVPGSSAGGASVLQGRVAEVARAMAPGSHAFLVKIDLPSTAGLRSGMFGRARFAGPPREALVVPGSALVQRGQVASVFVVSDDNRARLRLVTTGTSAEGMTEIAAGLDPGERIVVSPPASLADGQPVRLREAGAGTAPALPASEEVRR